MEFKLYRNKIHNYNNCNTIYNTIHNYCKGYQWRYSVAYSENDMCIYNIDVMYRIKS